MDTYQRKRADTPERLNEKSVYTVCCEEHPEEPLTNFCTALECLRPLCPECIDAHYRYHQEQRIPAEINSLRHVKQSCSRKLKAASLSLSQEIEKCELQYLLNPDAIVEENVRKLRKCKERLVSGINNFFEGMEESLRRRVHENMIKASDFNGIFDKMRNLNQEIDFLHQSLEQANPVAPMKKVLLLDCHQLMNRFKGEIHKIVETRDIDPISINIEESRYQVIRQELERLACFSLKARQDLQMSTSMTLLNANNPTLNLLNSSSKENVATMAGTGSRFTKEMVNVNSDNSNRRKQSKSGSGAQFQPQSLVPLDLFEVTVPDFFDQACKRRFLHFFQYDQDKLHILDLTRSSAQTGKPFFQTLHVVIDEPIPCFHKSIVTPSGDIFLTGGTKQNESKAKSEYIYKFHFEKSALVPVGSLQTPRSSHAMIYVNKYIYVVGGFGNKQSLLNKCERFHIEAPKSTEPIASMNHPVASLSVASFNNKHLFKFGGVGIEQGISQYIEKYDIAADRWIIIDYKVAPQIGKESFMLTSTSSCLQINRNSIMVFGGYDEENTGSNGSFLLYVEEDSGIYGEDTFTVRGINQKLLRHGEAFWNNQAVAHQGNVWVLQNIGNEANDNCLEDERRVIVFTGGEWRNSN